MEKGHQVAGGRWSRSWIVLSVLYGIFFYWYTSFEGPLTEEEMAYFSNVIERSLTEQEKVERWRAFMQNDTGDDFVVLNVIDLFDTPRPVTGAEPEESSQQVKDCYSYPFVSEALKFLIIALHCIAVATATYTQG